MGIWTRERRRQGDCYTLAKKKKIICEVREISDVGRHGGTGLNSEDRESGGWNGNVSRRGSDEKHKMK